MCEDHDDRMRVWGYEEAFTMSKSAEMPPATRPGSFTVSINNFFYFGFLSYMKSSRQHSESESLTFCAFLRGIYGFTNGIGSDPDADPDPSIFIINLQDTNQKLTF